MVFMERAGWRVMGAILAIGSFYLFRTVVSDLAAAVGAIVIWAESA